MVVGAEFISEIINEVILGQIILCEATRPGIAQKERLKSMHFSRWCSIRCHDFP